MKKSKLFLYLFRIVTLIVSLFVLAFAFGMFMFKIPLTLSIVIVAVILPCGAIYLVIKGMMDAKELHKGIITFNNPMYLAITDPYSPEKLVHSAYIILEDKSKIYWGRAAMNNPDYITSNGMLLMGNPYADFRLMVLKRRLFHELLKIEKEKNKHN